MEDDHLQFSALGHHINDVCIPNKWMGITKNPILMDGGGASMTIF